MGDTDALRDKIAQAIHEEACDCNDPDAPPYYHRLADAVLPVVTQETAQALSLLRSRVEALADQLDGEATETTPLRADDLRALAQSIRRSLSDNKEQQ